MPNHFHLILREIKSGGISKFLGKLSTSYSMYFNRKYERTGPLLCHPFRARHIHNDDYYRWVMSYVHVNPLDVMEAGCVKKRQVDRAKAQVFLREYPYSSYPDYFCDERRASRIVNKAELPIPIHDLEDVSDMLADFWDQPAEPETETLIVQG